MSIMKRLIKSGPWSLSLLLLCTACIPPFIEPDYSIKEVNLDVGFVMYNEETDEYDIALQPGIGALTISLVLNDPTLEVAEFNGKPQKLDFGENRFTMRVQVPKNPDRGRNYQFVVRHAVPPVLALSSYSGPAGTSGHGMMLDQKGTLYTWGRNDEGQLGNGTTNIFGEPQSIGTGYSAVAAGSRHSLALGIDGSLYAWGDNEFGQLGIGMELDHSTTPVLIGSGYTMIASYSNYSLALKADGTLMYWGTSWFDDDRKPVPIQVAENVASIFACNDIYGWLHRNGELVCIINDFEPVRTNITLDPPQFDTIEQLRFDVMSAFWGYNNKVFLFSDLQGKIRYRYCGNPEHRGAEVDYEEVLADIDELDSAEWFNGDKSSLYYLKNGNMYKMGEADTPYMKDIIHFAVDEDTLAILTKDGYLHLQGNLSFMSMGPYSGYLKKKPILIGSGFAEMSIPSYFLTKAGDLFYYFYNRRESAIPRRVVQHPWYDPRYTKKTIEYATPPPSKHSEYLDEWWPRTFNMEHRANGELYTWGANQYGTIGDGTVKNREEPWLVASDISRAMSSGGSIYAIDTTGQLWAWGQDIAVEGEVLDPVRLHEFNYYQKNPAVAPAYTAPEVVRTPKPERDIQLFKYLNGVLMTRLAEQPDGLDEPEELAQFLSTLPEFDELTLSYTTHTENNSPATISVFSYDMPQTNQSKYPNWPESGRLVFRLGDMPCLVAVLNNLYDRLVITSTPEAGPLGSLIREYSYEPGTASHLYGKGEFGPNAGFVRELSKWDEQEKQYLPYAVNFWNCNRETQEEMLSLVPEFDTAIIIDRAN